LEFNFCYIKNKSIPNDVIWGGQSSQVFLELKGDFMLPVVDQIDYLLNYTNLQIVVYSGQLDLIVDAIGTEKWINSLKWSGLPSFQNAQKTPLTGPAGNTGFFKTYKNLTFFWILKAGHMIPMDAGDTALQMLLQVLQPKSNY
jgi:serine carboxypeptidase 1